MSYRTRKRRRSRAFPNQHEEEEVVNGRDTTSAEKVSPCADIDADKEQENLPVLDEQQQKQLEIWESFKEEHYEVIEQLPLSLHRQYTLMRELDAQAQRFSGLLLPTLQKYIALRRSLASRSKPTFVVDEHESTGPDDSVPHPSPDAPANASSSQPSSTSKTGEDKLHSQQIDEDGRPLTTPLSTSDRVARTTTPASSRPAQSEPPETTRGLLKQIAHLSEETLRASEEKVNLAQAAYESVDRHIRLLDQVIKEQEASISLGIRPGTHLAPILLPDLVVPRWARPTRIEYSPVLSLSPEPQIVDSVIGADTMAPSVEDAKALGIVPTDGPGEGVEPRKKPSRRGKKEAVAQAVAEPAESEAVQEDANNHPHRVRSLRLMVTPQSQDLQATTVDADERFCYCNQVSFGLMIACDNKKCALEWFHLECVGLTEIPLGKWYCRECKSKGVRRGRQR